MKSKYESNSVKMQIPIPSENELNRLNDRVKSLYEAGLDGNAITLLEKIVTGIEKTLSDFKTALDHQTEKQTDGDEVEFSPREWMKILRRLEIAGGDRFTGQTMLQKEVAKTISDAYESWIVIGQRD
jgi:hypothetical protein